LAESTASLETENIADLTRLSPRAGPEHIRAKSANTGQLSGLSSAGPDTSPAATPPIDTDSMNVDWRM
jgi:hypothetical protein